MMGTDPFLWIGIAVPYPFHDPDADPPFVIRSRSSLSDLIRDRRSMIEILPITEYTHIPYRVIYSIKM